MEITLHLEVMDSSGPLEVDLLDFYENCMLSMLTASDELHKVIMNHLVYTTEGGKDEDFDPILWSLNLEVEGLGYVDLTLGDSTNPFLFLCRELEAILDYRASRPTYVEDEYTIAYLAYVSYDGWQWETKTLAEIKDRMSTYQGTYDYLSTFVDEMIEAGELDPVPDWVVHSEEESAAEAESMGYFSSYPVDWRVAVWR